MLEGIFLKQLTFVFPLNSCVRQASLQAFVLYDVILGSELHVRKSLTQKQNLLDYLSAPIIWKWLQHN